MARANTATLNWVKKLDPQSPPQPVSGTQGSKIRVYARSQWSTKPPKRFDVWAKPWWARIARALRLKKPTDHILVLEPPNGNISVSEGWTASPPDVPGQAEYYFEDEEENCSGTMTVTTKKLAVVLKGIDLHGGIASGGPHGVEVKIPLSARYETQVTHELAPVVDPEVRVHLLYPWAGEGDEHDLVAAALEWVEAEGLMGALTSVAAGMGPDGSVDPRAVLQALTEGFLSPENGGWEIWVDGGEPVPGREEWRERRLNIGVEQPRDVVVNIRPPAGGGRTCYALRIIDADGEFVTGNVVELEADEDSMRIREGLPE